MQIRPLELQDLPKIKEFADQTIGLNYFSLDELKDCYHKSISQNLMCSFVLAHDSEVHGIRLAYPPGAWSHGKGDGLSPERWKAPLEKVGYFQSLFISEKARGQGWGPKLSEASIQCFKKLGAQAIVTHAWKESPQNSSIRYLSKFGFTPVTTYPLYWVNVDYECTRDGKPCRCTAVEMIKYI